MFPARSTILAHYDEENLKRFILSGNIRSQDGRIIFTNTGESFFKSFGIAEDWVIGES